MTPEKRRVVVTGMGVVSALGLGVKATVEGLSNGRSGVGPVTCFDAASLAVRIAAEVKNFDPRDYVASLAALKLMTRAEGYALAAAKLALEQAGLTAAELGRAGLYLGSGKEIGSVERFFPAVRASTDAEGRVDLQRFGSQGQRLVYPLVLLESLPNACLYYIAETYRIREANMNVMTASAAGAQAIGEALRAVQWGESDCIVAGGFDARIDRTTLGSLGRLGLLSRRNHDPATACRPFDRTRDGCVLGEGAGMVVLEELGHARARRAEIGAELAGYATTTDTHGFLRPQPDGSSLARAIEAALRDAAMDHRQLDYINADGSGTLLGDKAETLAIKSALGEFASRVPVSSIKPMVGHLGAAAGAVELIAAILAMRTSCIPPTINYEFPDPSCDLDYVVNEARSAKLRSALSIGRGLGGQNTVLVVKQFVP